VAVDARSLAHAARRGGGAVIARALDPPRIDLKSEKVLLMERMEPATNE